MNQATIDNQTRILKDELAERIEPGASMAVAAPQFSMYAWRELRDELASLARFRFLYTSDTFLKDRAPKEQREFYIPRRDRERSLLGTEFEVRLRNELSQKADSRACAEWIAEKAEFRSAKGGCAAMPSVVVSTDDDCMGYLPLSKGFTTRDLGTSKGGSMLIRQNTESSRSMLVPFDAAWSAPNTEDVTQAVIDSMQALYRENAPELLYYTALSRIFEGYLDTMEEGELANERVKGFKDSTIWSMLYDFQRDAALAIINKLNAYGGCVLADSVGLGKTFTALSVIKYYEARGKEVLVLCPKKLADNWTTFNNNYTNNPVAADKFHYRVLSHTDLSRTRGKTDTGIDLAHLNWSNYDLVVIDESHNFRNGGDTASKNDDRENRYQRLVRQVIDEGVDTKVLMLSATPVNTRFRDLRNQLSLAYHSRQADWTERLGIEGNLDDVFKAAQQAYTVWSKLPMEERTTAELASRLSPDFFTVLDQVTVARSRKHIQRYYDAAAIGPFPRRNRPVSVRAQLTTARPGIAYHDIYDLLDQIDLAVYKPSAYVLPSRMAKYASGDGSKNLTSAGREQGVRKLMAANLLKRLESSVYSFRLTLKKVMDAMRVQIDRIEKYERTHVDAYAEQAGVFATDFDDDDEELLAAFEEGKKVVYHLSDMDCLTWKSDLRADLFVAQELLDMVAKIDPAHDDKLLRLQELIREKAAHPLNPGNKKVIVFTAFADTAEYLYEHVGAFASRELGLQTGVVTGARGARSTIKAVPAHMQEVITCFSPRSKDRDLVMPTLKGCDIDILIATDCISEGQNLQDCDYLVNYDIHWNPVRIVQRFGRVDRIGSHNTQIQLVNFWPDVELDEYINLKARVESRMKALVMTSTGDDNYIDEEDSADLKYREQQLRQMQTEVVDLEDVNGGVSITDLGLNEFRMDLVAYAQNHPELEAQPSGIDAVVTGEVPGIAFVLKNVKASAAIAGRNQLHPFYLVYLTDAGEVYHSHLDPKATLDELRLLCRGKGEPDAALCRAYNKETKNGRDMRHASELLGDAIASIVDAKQEDDFASLFSGGTSTFGEGDVAGLDDFELICFLVVRPQC